MAMECRERCSVYKWLAIPHPPHCPACSLAMQVLPYLLLLLLLPRTEGCKNPKARIITRAETKLTAKNLFEAPEVQKMLIQIIWEKFAVRVKKEDLIKMLYKKEIKYDEKIM